MLYSIISVFIIFIFKNCICGVKEFGNSGPLYTKPKAHTEEEEMAEDEQRKPK